MAKPPVVEDRNLEHMLKATAGYSRMPERDVALLLTLYGTAMGTTELAKITVGDYLEPDGTVKVNSAVRHDVAHNGELRPLYWSNRRVVNAMDKYLAWRLEHKHAATVKKGAYRGLDPDSAIFLTDDGKPYALTGKRLPSGVLSYSCNTLGGRVTTQQQYLREAAALLGSSQKALADRMGVPWPTFEKWLAPEGSKSFREMPGMAWCFVGIVVENHVLRQRLNLLQYPPMGGILDGIELSKEDEMSTNKPNLTSRDHKNMDAFLGHVLDDYKAGEITKEEAIGALAHVMAALDIGNTAEAVNWFEQGRKFIRSTR